MPYIDIKHIGKCETCRSFREGVGCSTYCDHGECYSPSLGLFLTSDVAPRSEVAKEIFEEADKIFMETCLSLEAYKAWCELKKKYTEDFK